MSIKQYTGSALDMGISKKALSVHSLAHTNIMIVMHGEEV